MVYSTYAVQCNMLLVFPIPTSLTASGKVHPDVARGVIDAPICIMRSRPSQPPSFFLTVNSGGSQF